MGDYNYTERVEQKFPCGCHIDEMIDGSYLIVYCPKHKAAPDMYEALEVIRKHGIGAAESLIDQALAKAEGKPTP